MTIASLLSEVKIHFGETKKLDAELLLSKVLKKPRSFLYAWPEQEVAKTDGESFKALCDRRNLGEPMAYLLGCQEFYGRSFKVSPQVLIPRPETELLIDLLLKRFTNNQTLNVLDLGTGSGVIAITLKCERPAWQICALDNSIAALKVAKQNANTLNADVEFKCNDWATGFVSQCVDIIVSNPPYIDENDLALEANVKAFEPKSALISGNQGLADIEKIIHDAKYCLKPNGFLIVEHGYQQSNSVTALFKAAGFSDITTANDLNNLPRCTMGVYHGGD